ncbi:aconitate hydratase AcnA [Candidatus Kryptobacter tengchongensis]|uniref:Aconitate hydratase n=1 Tax=Kryptobacter tengchongensis TaxID=1643429 RepID=A0A656D1I2_KRYT1|nr:aconitate hydratase AcnA [Candidatus Kryptobacter tengchongensis]CUS96400.1 aconitase [Candidatus Kryptobacter tengchongensis]
MLNAHPFKDAISTISVGRKKLKIFKLAWLEDQGLTNISKLPYSIRVLVENILRNCDNYLVTEDDVKSIASWQPKPPLREIPYMPARVLLQDFTGVPCVVDLASMRDAVKRLGKDPKIINPLKPVDLVIDHSVQVDYFGTSYAFDWNVKREFELNKERYVLLKWAQNSFKNFRVVPPGTGIIHQVNLEYLSKVVQVENGFAFPDTLVGTDSHTTMINGIGVLGWGVGGIEAEAVMLGQPYYITIPEVIGVKLTGELPEGATATDLVLTVTNILRKKGVVEKFVEFFGPGVSKLPIADRATIANMAPEYGATCGFFPIDEETINYLKLTGRENIAKIVETYAKEQGLFRYDDSPFPEYTDIVEIDLSQIEPTLAGPSRPQDKVLLREIKSQFEKILKENYKVNEEPKKTVEILYRGQKNELTHGSVVIAAITSCTNTSNPTVLIGAGILAKKAVEKGLTTKPYVKTSLAPGSRVVTEYLQQSGLMPYLEALGFHLVGYGCTTCIGNSGPLPEPVSKAITENNLVVCAVLSGNRNFEARVHPLVKANYLASPILVVAYALAGKINIDFNTEPIGYDPNGNPVYLKDIWPTQNEIKETINKVLNSKLFKKKYADVFEGNNYWKEIPITEGELFDWDPNSTYIQNPPFFENLTLEPEPPKDITNAYCLGVFGDSITTDHISPAGSISENSPAGKYLIERGVPKSEFNTFGARRGAHEVMIRGTFGNVRLKNLLLPGVEGGWTIHIPTGEKMSIYDAAMRYKQENRPLIIIAGKEYGTGSSRDWAAKGTYLLGVKAVIAESFERIHRSNLVGMGVLPLQFKEGENRETLGLTGFEEYTIEGIAENLYPQKTLKVTAKSNDGSIKTFEVIARLDTPVEVEYYVNGGIMQTVLRKLLKNSK